MEEFKEVLVNRYGYRSLDHQMKLNYHHFTIKDSKQRLGYDLLVGYQDMENYPDYIVSPSFSFIRITPISNDPHNLNLFPPTRAKLAENPRNPKFRDFIKTTQTWAKFIEDAVNAMSRVKGIPQSGTLTLLPPSEIPQ